MKSTNFWINYFRNKYELDIDFIDILQGFPDYPGIDDGTADQFVNEVLPLFLYEDLSLDQNYEKVNELMDLDNMIDYFIAQTYMLMLTGPVVIWNGGAPKIIQNLISGNGFFLMSISVLFCFGSQGNFMAWGLLPSRGRKCPLPPNCTRLSSL